MWCRFLISDLNERGAACLAKEVLVVFGSSSPGTRVEEDLSNWIEGYPQR